MTTDPNQREARIAYAESLTEFTEQSAWYDKRAVDHKLRAQLFDLGVILCGALIAALPVLKTSPDIHPVDVFIAGLGVLVVVFQGAQQVFRFSDTWPEYRRARQFMEHERRAFINAEADYAGTEQSARKRYVAQLQSLLRAEHQTFFEKQEQAKADGED